MFLSFKWDWLSFHKIHSRPVITIFFSSYQGKPKKSFFSFPQDHFFLSRSLCFYLKTFPTFSLRPFFFILSFSFLFFLSRCQTLRDPYTFSPTLLVLPLTESLSGFLKKPLSSFSKRLIFSSFFQTFLLSICTTPFSFPFSSGKSSPSPLEPQLIQLFLSRGGQLPFITL